MVNEDGAAVFKLNEKILLAVIADGMGGHQGGDFASSTAIRVIGEEFIKLKTSDFLASSDWAEWLKETIYHVNRLLFNYSEENEAYKGMGTTLDVVLIIDRSCLVFHVGDSRIYEITNNGINQVTRDHSYVNILIDSGEITEEEAAVHPQRNLIMKALGSERTIDPDFHTIKLETEMYLLICTDGLSNKVDSNTIQSIVLSDNTLNEKAEKLVGIANELGGEDNISVILLKPLDTEVSVQ